jgi:Rieske Fe-S protein
MKIKTFFMERRKFLQNTCPTVTFAFFGLSFIQACSKSDDEDSAYGSNSNGNSNDPYGNDSQSSNGITESGNTLTLDLTNSTFSGLSSPGDFINLTSVGVLLLKISNTNFRAFDNCCPHSGSKNAWSYANEEFKCGTHGNTFGIDGNNIVNCGSASTSGDLKTYSTSLNNDTLTITTS